MSEPAQTRAFKTRGNNFTCAKIRFDSNLIGGVTVPFPRGILFCAEH